MRFLKNPVLSSSLLDLLVARDRLHPLLQLPLNNHNQQDLPLQQLRRQLQRQMQDRNVRKRYLRLLPPLLLLLSMNHHQ